ncbi:MAG: AAA family ATPase, partial [Proteobacteria bacterium]|nr:AAA family ATPase [Pseudomonadota bacterium]
MAHKFPIGIQTFRRIREEGYVYVDKTDLVYELVHGSVFNFLSRPRRFGKSLLVSTLHAYFDGRKDLFEGLAIETLETEWIKRPVFHLDLSGANYSRPEALEVLLDVQIDQWEKEYGSSPNEKTLEARFKGVIGRAKEKTGQQVALLIDEYEKPILDTIGKPELQAVYREMLHGFYGCIKPSEEYFKFVLLTGVTKIGKLSVFSALNNITEMTFDSRYASICGITEKQVHAYFDEDIRRMADVNDITFEEMCERLKIQYDGYHF